jgi:hypothetical protein
MFSHIILNKFDITKLEQKYSIGSAKTPYHPEWYVQRLVDNPNSVITEGLSYIQYLVENYSRNTNRAVVGLSWPGENRFALRDDNGQVLTIDGKEYKELTLKEYLTAKIEQLIKLLYQEPNPDIRTDFGAPSSEAKKPRGPFVYTKE